MTTQAILSACRVARFEAHLTIKTDDCFHSLVMSLEVDKGVASFPVHLDFQNNTIDLEQFSQLLVCGVGGQVANIDCSNRRIWSLLLLRGI